jgi:hypothetical protein
MSPDWHSPTVLPIPDRPRQCLSAYDAKDPGTSFSAIEPLLPVECAPTVRAVLVGDVCFGAASTRSPC